MVLLDEGEEVVDEDRKPYGYGHLLAVGHMMLRYNGPGQEKTGLFADGRHHMMHILRVRWYEQDDSYKSGWRARRLPRLMLLPSHEKGAYGFLDPMDVIRGWHIIPAFRYDDMTQSTGQTAVRSVEDDTEEHPYYYAGM